MPSNNAAWQTTAKASPLSVASAAYTSPAANEIVMKNAAVAINPVDWALQAMGDDLFPWLKYPCIMGGDCAGEVAEVGSGVSRFKVGDRVVGLADGLTSNNPAEGAFQEYVVLQENLVSAIPRDLTYESAAVLPLCLSTAASGLFQTGYLALQHPSLSPKPTGKTLLVWGGSTSVGCNAIQLAVAGGYEVITTSSPKNFDYVKKLGATLAFDYSSETVIDDLITAFKGKTLAGAICIVGLSVPTAADSFGDSSTKAMFACADVLIHSEGAKFVAATMHPPKDFPEGVSTKFILGSSLKDDEVGKAIYEDFLPKALAEGKYVCAPEAQIVGKGLESVQAALDIQKNGVSARKVVVSL